MATTSIRPLGLSEAKWQRLRIGVAQTSWSGRTGHAKVLAIGLRLYCWAKSWLLQSKVTPSPRKIGQLFRGLARA